MKENFFPFNMITALFFLWGIAHGLLNALDKHFQDILQIAKANSAMIQYSLYMAYLSMALPAGFLAAIPLFAFIFFYAVHVHKTKGNGYGVS